MELKEQFLQTLHRLKLRLGIIPPLEQEQDHIEKLKKDPQIPPEYVQRFMLEPLQEPGQVGGREEALKSVLTAYENWKQSRMPLLVDGEPGCGMTSFLNAGLAQLEHAFILPDDQRIDRSEQLFTLLSQALGTEETHHADAFAAALSDEPKVIIFENVERLFLRKINGFDLLEAFLLLVQQTREKIFWIITTNKYPLDYLDLTLHFRKNFPNILKLSNFDPEYIQQTLEFRNRDYRLTFLKPAHLPPQLERTLTHAGKAQKQDLLRAHFFKQLHGFAKGHISRSLLFWIKSVVGIRSDEVFLKPFEPKSPASIERPEEWFVLEAIFQHDSLCSSNLSRVIRHSTNQCQLILSKLLEEEWISPRKMRNGRQEYQINLLYMNELQFLLREKLTRKSM